MKKTISVLLLMMTVLFSACSIEVKVPVIPTEPVEEVGEAVVIVSEFGEGTSNNKAIELVNIGTADADLNEYRLAFYYNDSTEATYIELEGILFESETFVITHSSFDLALDTELDGNQVTMGLRHNGDDEFALEKLINDVWTEVDVIGLIAERGLTTSWGSDKTYVRNYNVENPSSSFIVNEWTIYEVDYFVDLGNHSTSGNDSVSPVITIDNSISRVFEVGSELPNFSDYFIIFDNIDGEVIVTNELISGTDAVDMTVQGLYELSVTVNDNAGNSSTKILTIRVYDPNSTELVLTHYYESVEGLVGVELKEALNLLIDEHITYTYDEVWDILKEADEDPDNSDNVLLIYTGLSYSKECQDAGAYSTCDDVWNREHVWSKSRGDFGTLIGPGTDVHHLRAADKNMNSTRNNRLFDICEIEISYGNDKCDYWAFEPRDEVKGDVARMLFYMATRYEGYDEFLDLELNEEILDKEDKSAFHGKLSLLIEWNLLDPVSDFERQRNEVIYEYQGNRNPFIDYPEFANMIFN